LDIFFKFLKEKIPNSNLFPQNFIYFFYEEKARNSLKTFSSSYKQT